MCIHKYFVERSNDAQIVLKYKQNLETAAGQLITLKCWKLLILYFLYSLKILQSFSQQICLPQSCNLQFKQTYTHKHKQWNCRTSQNTHTRALDPLPSVSLQASFVSPLLYQSSETHEMIPDMTDHRAALVEPPDINTFMPDCGQVRQGDLQ